MISAARYLEVCGYGRVKLDWVCRKWPCACATVTPAKFDTPNPKAPLALLIRHFSFDSGLYPSVAQMIPSVISRVARTSRRAGPRAVPTASASSVPAEWAAAAEKVCVHTISMARIILIMHGIPGAYWSQELRGKKSVEDLTWHTPEGIDVKPVYTAEDVDVCAACACV